MGADELVLKNGGMMRGDVVEMIPGSHVVIVVAGESRTIPWAEVERVDRNKHTPKPIEVAPSPSIPPTIPTGVRVHLDVRRGKTVELQRLVGGLYASGYGMTVSGMSWNTVCASPCDRVIDTSGGQAFVLGNNPFVFSRKFRLENRRGTVRIDVKPGSGTLIAFGIIFTGIGGGLAIGGPLLLAVSGSTPSFRTPGIILTAVGLPMLAVGIPMLVFGRTRYKFR